MISVWSGFDSLIRKLQQVLWNIGIAEYYHQANVFSICVESLAIYTIHQNLLGNHKCLFWRSSVMTINHRGMGCSWQSLRARWIATVIPKTFCGISCHVAWRKSLATNRFALLWCGDDVNEELWYQRRIYIDETRCSHFYGQTPMYLGSLIGSNTDVIKIRTQPLACWRNLT